jgi:hypothetical protein
MQSYFFPFDGVSMDDSCWMLQAEDGEVIIALQNVHHPIKCHERSCVLHNPSEHHMRRWPLLYRQDHLVQRVCPHHLGHPDPDSLAFRELIAKEAAADHGCDGCCRTGLRPIRYIRPTGLPPT